MGLLLMTSMDTPTVAQAVALHRAGMVTEAAVAYRRLLKTDFTSPELLHRLGISQHQMGRHDDAVALVRRAIALVPAEAPMFSSLGTALKASGQVPAAAAAFRRALVLAPGLSQLHYNFGNLIRILGVLRGVEPKVCFQRAIALDPDFTDVYNNLAMYLTDAKRSGAAVVLLRRALRLNPIHADAHLNLTTLLNEVGGPGETGERSFRTRIALDPADLGAWEGIGRCHEVAGRADEAIAAAVRAIAVEPGSVDLRLAKAKRLKALGRRFAVSAAFRDAARVAPLSLAALSGLFHSLHGEGRLEEARGIPHRAACLVPDGFTTWATLALIKREVEDFSAAETAIRRALVIAPDHPDLIAFLAVVLTAAARNPEAIDVCRDFEARGLATVSTRSIAGLAYWNIALCEEGHGQYRKVVEAHPEFQGAHSNSLFLLNYLPEMEAGTVAARHREFGDLHAGTAARWVERDEPDPPARRLRVGYVSPDFRSHPVAHFFEAVVDRHDRDRFEVFCYAEVRRPDIVTNQLYARADHWRSTVGLTDEEVADRIVEDGIDILVDLAGHTAHSRLMVFALKPAPVQVSWIGYPNTTGLRQMDYRITDGIADPVGETEHLHTERLIRLPGGFLCYRPGPSIPDVRPRLPAAPGEVTFGSFNNLNKINRRVVTVWAEILKRLPRARLIMKAKPLRCERTREMFQGYFGEEGIAEGRVTLLGAVASLSGHLDVYNQVDIGLDPFPYNGTTTTFEALSMGVPVVTLSGRVHVARVGETILRRLALDELVAPDIDAYIETAVALAMDRPRLAAYRQEMRQRLWGSTMRDEAGFLAELEAAYLQMWADRPVSVAPDRRRPAAPPPAQGKPTTARPRVVDPMERVHQAVVELSSGRLESAERICREALAVDEGYAEALNAMAMIRGAQRRPQEALGFSERALAAAPFVAHYHSARGAYLHDLGRIEESIAAQHEAIRLAPYVAPFHIALAMGLERQGKLDDALASYRRATELSLFAWEAQNNIGILFAKKGEFAEALPAFLAAQQIVPAHPGVLENCLDCLIALGDHQRAAHIARRLLALVPTHVKILAKARLVFGKTRDEGGASLERRIRQLGG